MKLEKALKGLKKQDAQVVDRFIQNSDWKNIPSGFTEINDRIGVVKLEIEQPIELADKLEFHKKAIDFHYVVSGIDKVRRKALIECTILHTEYQEKDDYGLYADEATEEIDLLDSEAILFRPETAHMALCGQGAVKKLVFKIKVD